MKMTITNTSKANQGVHNAAGGIDHIEAGQTREIDVAEDYVERVKSLAFLDVADLDSKPAQPAKPGKAPKPAKPGKDEPEPDQRSDDELRAAVIEQLGEDGAADLDREAMLAILAPAA